MEVNKMEEMRWKMDVEEKQGVSHTPRSPECWRFAEQSVNQAGDPVTDLSARTISSRFPRASA